MKIDAQIPQIVFVGGLFTAQQTAMIEADSRGVIQNAADSLQKKIVYGLSKTYPGKVSVLNFPYVGSFPTSFSKLYFPPTEEQLFVGVRVSGRRFLTLRVLNSFSRAWVTFRGLFDYGREPKIVVIYAAHLPFRRATLAHKCSGRKTLVFLVLPDFPEFMGTGGLIYNAAKFVESTIFYCLSKYIDGFVLLTQPMAEKLGIDSKKYVVMEGIADHVGQCAPSSSVEERVFLYSGTLASRYGIPHLLEAFSKVNNPRARLWICGDGDSRDAVSEAAKKDSRVLFLGQINRNKVLELQKLASVLINPRQPEGDYVKYSFPSKTLEYMSSGRPVLMYKLPGMPDEYDRYFYQPHDTSVEALTDTIEELSKFKSDILEGKGRDAMCFVQREKSALPQGKKISDFIQNYKFN